MRPDCVWLALFLFFFAFSSTGSPIALTEAQIEADWLFQEEVCRPKEPMNTVADAAGGCDGVIDGKWGFHTDRDEPAWWQVDLGEPYEIRTVAVYNREDMIERAGGLSLLLSDDAGIWREVYVHDGTPFRGHSDGEPLRIELGGQTARYVRVQIAGPEFLHLDEVQVFGADPELNLALRRPADQSSSSQWSHGKPMSAPTDWRVRADEIIGRLVKDPHVDAVALSQLGRRLARAAGEEQAKALFLDARRMQRARTLAQAHSIMGCDDLLFVKRVPGSYSHMSDQFYGWWSRPGGGIYILRDAFGPNSTVERIPDAFTEPGSFLRPTLSYDGTRVLFAWCRHYPGLAEESDKLNKDNVPEDAFYSIFEMNIDGSGLRRLTRGKYDDFDARYLPDGRIVFLSTRRGQFLQCGPQTAALTMTTHDLPDVYVRCGGGPQRPVAVYTLHTMEADGSNICAISPFEMFEWSPAVARDGTILHSRWDYIDRDNMPYMSLWTLRPDGTHPRLIYGNYTHAPHCTFEPLPVPESNKIVLTASGHHAQTIGSLVLLDPTVGTEGEAPIRRLTPEVVFPEIEGWPDVYYASPWPLSERFYLTAWGPEVQPREGQRMSKNAMGIYLLDAERGDSAAGNIELLYRDPEISSQDPIPLRPQPAPPVVASMVAADTNAPGAFLLTDVYRGLNTVKPGDIKALRVVAVPPKTHPTMNAPVLGVTQDDPGKCVLGTVPVEEDGSAFFHVPPGVIVFFQALDAEGKAVQTMKSTTHAQPGETLSCIGCHESRHEAPAQKRPLAAMREPSKLTLAPDGAWPLRFDRLVQPVLDAHCTACHSPEGAIVEARAFDLTSEKSYESLVKYGSPSLLDEVWAGYRAGVSTEGRGLAANSPLLAKITAKNTHNGVRLDPESLERLITWMDAYAQRLGSFDYEQERQLLELRARSREFIIDREQRHAGAPRF